MANINLKKIKDLYRRYLLTKMALSIESDFKIKREMQKTLLDLQNQIESEIGAPITKKDRDIFF